MLTKMLTASRKYVDTEGLSKILPHHVFFSVKL